MRCKLTSYLFVGVMVLASASAPAAISSTCKEVSELTVMNPYLGNAVTQRDLDTLPPAQIAARYNNYQPNERGIVAWVLLMYPRVEVSLAAYRIQTELAQLRLTEHLVPGTLDGVLASLSNSPPVYSAAGLQKTNRTLEEILADTYFDDHMALVMQNAFLACAPYPGVPGCGATLQFIAEFMHPHSHFQEVSYSALPLMRTVLTDPLYAQGAARLARAV